MGCSLGGIQRFSATHAKDHVCLACARMIRKAINLRIGTVCPKKYGVHNLKTAFRDRIPQELTGSAQCFFASDQQHAAAKWFADLWHVIIRIRSDCIICKINRI